LCLRGFLGLVVGLGLGLGLGLGRMGFVGWWWFLWEVLGLRVLLGGAPGWDGCLLGLGWLGGVGLVFGVRVESVIGGGGGGMG
jgi:hypothetical protein